MATSFDPAVPRMKDVAEFNPLDPATVEDPYPFYAALRAQAPVYLVPGLGFAIASTYAAVLELIADPKRFSSNVGAQAGGFSAEIAEVMQEAAPPVDTLLTCDPPDHIRYRSLVQRAFAARRVARMEPQIRAVVEEVADDVAGEGARAFDWVSRFAVPVPLTVIADQLGVPRSDMPLFKKWSDDAVAPLGGMISSERQVGCAHSLVEFQRYMENRIEERRQAGRDDMLSDLVEARLDGVEPLNVPEMLSILQQILVAGNETTSNVIASATRLLLENPGQLECVRADRSLIPNMVDEAIRLESPVQGLFRVATCDTQLAGTEVTEGTRIIAMFASANRDEAAFSAAERFDVRRENARSHLGFSRGEHFCVGAALARKELEIVFETVLDRFPNLELAPGNDFAHEPSFILRGLKRLDVVL